MPMRRAVALGILAFAVAACGGNDKAAPDGDATPRATATPRGLKPAFTYHPCEFGLPEGQVDGETVACGTLDVPERRDGAGERRIKLQVAILRAESDDPRPDPLIYLAGGPGARALEDDLSWFYAEDLQRDRDVIFFDQRGAGFSTPSLSCGEYDVKYFAHRFSAQEDGADQALRECRDRLAQEADLSAYNSAENARDIADLAAALGYEEYNLYGVSYGTRLALTAMRDAPASIRSVILDSTLPLQANVYAENGALFEATLESYVAACAATTWCAEEAPDLRGALARAVAQLESSPAVVDVVDVGTGAWYREAIDGGYFLGLLFDAFYSTYLLTELPRGIEQVSRGDYRMLSELASYSSRRAGDAYGMYLSVECAEEMPFEPETIAPLRNAFPGMAAEWQRIATSVRGDCAIWNVPPATPVEREPVHSDIPTLVLAGEFDPITPPIYGRRAAETLTRATYVEFAGHGHGVLDAGCAMDIVVAFLNAPEAPVDTACAAEFTSF